MCLSGPAVNTSLYAYLPLSMRKIVLKICREHPNLSASGMIMGFQSFLIDFLGREEWVKSF